MGFISMMEEALEHFRGNKEAIELLYKKAKEDGLVLEGEERMAESIGTITIFPDHSGGSINTF